MDILWITLTTIFAFLLLILLFSKKGKDKPNREINIHDKIVINDINNQKINTPSRRISLSENSISLKELVHIFKNYGLELNTSGIFEKKINADYSYYVANLNEPGYFKNDRNIKGFTFFYVAKNHIFDRHVSDQMEIDSGMILNEMNGVLLESTSQE
tara:strand:+ start:3075 stop:3545 length:471 start_codon:yes stop_codon:yes gene_type:complete